MNFFEKIWWIISRYYLQFLQGIGVTLLLAFVGTIIGLIIALFLAILRIQKPNKRDSKLVKGLKIFGSGFAKVYITVFRGTPMIVQAMIIYFGFATAGMTMAPLIAGLITVSLNTTAYLAEVIRGGIQSVDPGQMEASRSLGFNQFQTFVHIVLPQAIKNTMPSIGNEFIINIKDTSVLSVIQVVDLYRVADLAGNAKAIYFESMIVAACIYLFLTLVTTKVLNYIEKRMDMPVKALPSAN